MDWPSLTIILSTPFSFYLHILFIFVLCYLFLESRWDGDIKASGKLCFEFVVLICSCAPTQVFILLLWREQLFSQHVRWATKFVVSPLLYFEFIWLKSWPRKQTFLSSFFNLVLIEKRWKNGIYIYMNFNPYHANV